MNIASQKITARKAAYARRAKAHGNVNANIIPYIKDIAQQFHIVAAYMPIRTEIDPLPAMRALHKAGKKVCIPVIIQNEAPLIFCEWAPEMEMVAGAFGALIPAEQKPIIPEIVIAPLVAYDRLGTRLGYGGGFYDRTVELLREAKPTPYFGLAYSMQMSEAALPKEDTDITLDGIITEKGIQSLMT